MSRASKVALGGACIFTTSIVAYVHLKQNADRKSLREGVIKDIQRQAMKKTQNVKALQDQIELTKALERQRDQDLKKKSENR